MRISTWRQIPNNNNKKHHFKKTEGKMELRLVILSLCILLAVKTVTAGRVVCYYGTWATYRPGHGQCNVEDLDPSLCTHLIYGFIGLDETNNNVKLLDPYNDLEENWGKGAIKRFNNLRTINPELKTMVAIGGWNEGSSKYSAMASSKETRKIFINSATQFLLNYGFNGLDIDWEYPTQRGGIPIDRENYVALLSEIRGEFDKHGLILSAAVAAGQYTVDAAYNVPALSQYLDFINIMAYDFHGGWESTTGHNAPLYARPEESPDDRLLNVNASVKHWIQQGAALSKLNLGMGMYGHSFTLMNAENNGLCAPATGPGRQGPYTQEGGTLGYNEICEYQMAAKWTVVQDTYYKSPYMYSGDQWVGYDDENSITEKCKFAESLGLGGGMIWSIETDDFRGICGKKYPLLKIINGFFYNPANPPQPAPQPTPQPQPEPAPQPSPQPQPAPKPGPQPQPAPKPAPQPQPEQPSSSPSSSESDAEAYAIQQCSKSSLVRHPTNCSIFFECQKTGSTYQVYEKQCQNGLLFDTTVNTCNWKYLVVC